jgi:mannose-1-phosphate guanylyltransferase
MSRQRRAKQLLALNGPQTMIQQTFSRLKPLADRSHFWVITNEASYPALVKQLPDVPRKQVIAEPVGRNTAPAIGLAAFILAQQDSRAVLGMFPADHAIGNERQFLATLSQAIALAASGDNLVVLGMHPTRAETGYGYIEVSSALDDRFDERTLRVRRFTEKPDAARAAAFLRAGKFYWNSGMFLWSARTLQNMLTEHLPRTAAILQRIASDFGTRKFAATLRRLYPKCENISVDYAVLEPQSAKGELASNLFCLPASFEWNDLGSWTALHEHQVGKTGAPDDNVIRSNGTFTLNALRNYVYAPRKFVAAVGVHDLIVVETDDALLITSLEHSQDVGKVVKYLDEKKLKKLV